MPTIVYRYGLLPPVTEAERVSIQIHKAHEYQNRLIEIERNHRDARDKVTTQVEPLASIAGRCAVIEKELAEARQALSAVRADARDKTAGDDTHARNLAAELRKLWPERKAALKQVLAMPQVQTELAALDQKRKDAVKAARASCEVYWGTYLQIEAAVEQARKTPAPPRFQRWTGEGAVAVQLMKGLPIAEALEGTDQRIRLALAPVAVPDRGGSPLPRVFLRVGSTEDRHPIFAEWPLVYHRPMPDQSVLKWAKVVRRRVGGHDVWSLHLTIEVPPPSVPAPGSAIAVNLRWSRAGADVTTAAEWTDGQTAAVLTIDEAIDGMLHKSDDLRSIRDKNFEKEKAILREQLAGLAPIPPDHSERLEYLHAWKAQAKLAVHVIWWRDHRFRNDDAAFLAAEAWRKQDKHLWQWEANARRKALARRRDGYRVFAAQAARTHSTLVIEKLNIARLAKTPAPEDERDLNPKASSQRFGAAPSELRSALINAFRRDGKTVAEVPAGLTSAEMLAQFQNTGGAPLAAPAARSQCFARRQKNKGKPASTPDASAP
jgi:hypothetical protein